MQTALYSILFYIFAAYKAAQMQGKADNENEITNNQISTNKINLKNNGNYKC